MLRVQVRPRLYSVSNPWVVNFSVRQFSVTRRWMVSGTAPGTFASISSVTRTSAPGIAARWAMTSWAILPVSAPARHASRGTHPWKQRGGQARLGAGPASPVPRAPGSLPSTRVLVRRRPGQRAVVRCRAVGELPQVARGGPLVRSRTARCPEPPAAHDTGRQPHRSCRRRPSRTAPTSTAGLVRRGR